MEIKREGGWGRKAKRGVEGRKKNRKGRKFTKKEGKGKGNEP